MMAATITSGQPVLVPKTPSAASMTARFPGVVARANPDRAHIRVARAETVEHERDSAVGDERGNTDNAHDLGPRQSAVRGVPGGAAEHPKGKEDEGAALDDSRAGTPAQRQAGNAKADGVIGRVAEKIERIGLQRRRTGGRTGHDFRHKKRPVDELALHRGHHREGSGNAVDDLAKCEFVLHRVPTAQRLRRR